MNRDESDQAAAAASIDQDPVTVKPIGGEYGFPGWHTVLLGGKALRHFAQLDAADRYAEGIRIGRDSVKGADPGLTARMATALTGALNYIEHSHANRGKATSDAEWDANVAAFRKQGVSQLGIGRSYTDKAQIDLALCREVLAEYVRAKPAAVESKQAERYLVTWQIDSDAATPVAAAQEAWGHMRGEDSIANVFEVRDRAGHVVVVDLADLPNRIPDLADESEEGMKRWFREMHELGLIFHPDDPPHSIVNGLHGERVFSDAECERLRPIMETLFDRFGDRVYEEALRAGSDPDDEDAPEGMSP